MLVTICNNVSRLRTPHPRGFYEKANLVKASLIGGHCPKGTLLPRLLYALLMDLHLRSGARGDPSEPGRCNLQ